MSNFSNIKKPFTVFVEGNIGCGKTTFLNYFNKDEDFHICAEPVEKWRNFKGHNLLELMYENTARWSFAFQSMVQQTMLEMHVEQPNTGIKMMERSIHSARHVFVDNLVDSGKLQSAELAVLDAWYEFITTHLDTSGDLIIYLRTSPEIVDERIKQRSRSEERTIPLSYLSSLHELHEKWLLNKTHATCKERVIVIDANKSMSEMEEEFHKCRDLIKRLSDSNYKDQKEDFKENQNQNVISSPPPIVDVA